MNKKLILVVGIVIFITLAVVAALRVINPEDTWICNNGIWVQHGQPSSAMPTETCE